MFEEWLDPTSLTLQDALAGGKLSSVSDIHGHEKSQETEPFGHLARWCLRLLLH